MLYNLPGIAQQIRLTGQIIADIYLGNITEWNASQIKAINPRRRSPEHEDHAGLPVGRVGDELQLHGLPLEGEPGVRREGRQVDAAPVPARSRSTRELRRRRRREEHARRDRICRRRLRAAEQAAVRQGQEQGGRLRNAGDPRSGRCGGVDQDDPLDNAISLVDPPASAGKLAYPICTFTWVIVPLQSKRR